MSSKPSIPKGTRDFEPAQVRKRQFIFDTIRKTFVRYGYQPIETPVMEELSTLTGKYGDEGDKLLFKVLNNGDFLAKADENALNERDSNKIIASISKRGLRYDLTVPFARFVVMHQNALAFPFKRYQIQPVWRADRPQKGRYQEFYQCDVDVVGTPDTMSQLIYEAELVQIYDNVFHDLGLKTVIKINNRKVLMGMAEAAGIGNQFMDMTIAIDKLDKIGVEGVAKELRERGISDASIATIEALLNNTELSAWAGLLAESPTGLQGIQELQQVMQHLSFQPLHNTFEFDPTLARGLNYYTGCIFEVKADTNAYPNLSMGSIGGGGRYDDLTGVFGMSNMSGVGVSFGAERIYDVLEELDLFPQVHPDSLQLMFISFDTASLSYAFQMVTQLRAAGINADLYPEPAKLKKQMKYANDLQVPNVVLVGESEVTSGLLTLKNMVSGEQSSLSIDNLIAKFS